MYISIVSILYRYVNTLLYVCRYQITPSITRFLRLLTIMTMGSNAASLYAPTPTTPACAGGGHRVSRQAEVEDEAMSVWLRHRCLRSPQRSLDARRPSWCGGSSLCEHQRASTAPVGAWLCTTRLPHLLTLSRPYYLLLSRPLFTYLTTSFFQLTLSFSITLYPSLSHPLFPTTIYLFLSPHTSPTLSSTFSPLHTLTDSHFFLLPNFLTSPNAYSSHFPSVL